MLFEGDLEMGQCELCRIFERELRRFGKPHQRGSNVSLCTEKTLPNSIGGRIAQCSVKLSKSL